MDQVLMGKPLVDQSGNSIGKITDVIVDPTTLEPEWLTVKTGMLGGEHLVPIKAVESENGTVVAPFGKDKVKAAPTAAQHTAPTEPEREALYSHYGMTPPPSGTDQLHEKT